MSDDHAGKAGDGLLDELDLGTPRPPRGDTLEHPGAEPQWAKPTRYVAFERELTPADLDALATAPARSSRPRSLLRIHASHHALARCIATGMRANQAALVTGYSPSRIGALCADPAFAALVEDYRREAKSVFADLAERMNELSLDAIELLQERLHDAPETLTVPVLLDIIKSFADRTGHGPGAELTLRAAQDFIDRPPRETYEEWRARRDRELEANAAEIKKLN